MAGQFTFIHGCLKLAAPFRSETSWAGGNLNDIVAPLAVVINDKYQMRVGMPTH